MTKRIVITGSAGFIGSHLADKLLELGYEVYGVDNLSMGAEENFQHNLNNPRFKFFKSDIRNSRSLCRITKDASAIVHLAAFKIPRYGNAIDTLLINTEGTKNVLEAARLNKCSIVFGSTSDVYGKNPNLPFREDSDSVFGSSKVSRWSYAVSKLFDEHMVFAYCESYGLPVVILRFFGAYGPRHHLSWWGGPQSVFIDAILRNRAVPIHGTGKQTRTFIYISDLVDGIVRALKNRNAHGEIFNLGSTKEISIIELARKIKTVSETKGKLRFKFIRYSSFGKSKYEDVLCRVPDISLARKVLGFSPGVSLEKGLAATIAWQGQEICRR